MGNSASKDLLRACKCGDTFDIHLFLKRGANVEYRDSYGNTPLLTAITNNHANHVEVLLNNRYSCANPDHTDTTGNTPLMVAANKLEIVRLLINSGCQLNKTNRFKDSALHLAVRIENAEVVELLVKSGIDVTLKNKNGQTALDMALLLDNGPIGNILLSKQQNFKSFDQNILTRMLQHALASDNRARAQLLLEHVTSLKVALLEIPYRKEDSQMVENLIQRCLNQDSSTCKCLLFYPVKYRDAKWTKILIERGIPFNASLLDIAYINRDFEMVNILIEKGLEHKIDQGSSTPMIYYCVKHYDHTRVQKLLKHKSYINILNRVESLLDPTDSCKNTETVALLLDIDRNRDQPGFTPYEYYRDCIESHH
ncbi:ankyrin repeat domain-containing protein 50 [Patella vulgata]|uniref:ankyrin repeat domain-containing protein 50 n=1 Tax=Patella vulgata TaxID=6465 RepID=UPI00217F9AA8|nr:ankyrin repeat domain-containing protein 50 [Patella vulgata]XP_050411129.1 ankyrin repeat domain-containing protein 50 [Patella vulgata]